MAWGVNRQIALLDLVEIVVRWRAHEHGHAVQQQLLHAYRRTGRRGKLLQSEREYVQSKRQRVGVERVWRVYRPIVHPPQSVRAKSGEAVLASTVTSMKEVRARACDGDDDDHAQYDRARSVEHARVKVVS